MGKKGTVFGRIILVILTLSLIFMGCEKKSDAEAPAAADAPAEGARGDELVVYANKSLDYYFFAAVQEGVKRAVEQRGWRFQASVADFDSSVQTSQFENFIARRPLAILSDPIDSEGLIDVIERSVDAGVPVGIVDTPTTGGRVAVTVAFDNKLAGIMAAEKIVELLIEKYGEPRGKVFNAYGALSSWAWRLRKEGFEEVMARYPDIEYIPAPGEGDIVKTNNALINALTRDPDIDAVHCPSDTPAIGMAEALKQKDMWKKVGEEGHVIFVTIDGEPVAQREIEAGYYDASVVQDAVSYGLIAVELMDRYTFQGNDVPLGPYVNTDFYWEEAEIVQSPSGPYVVIPPYYMDETNVQDPRHWGTIAEKNWGLAYN